MLTPSEIELLRQDLRAALKVIGQDEIDDAHSLLEDCGFRKRDFEILQRADRSQLRTAPITGVVAVRRKSTGAAKVYKAGSGSSWLTEFDADLKSGAFGSPG